MTLRSALDKSVQTMLPSLNERDRSNLLRELYSEITEAISKGASSDIDITSENILLVSGILDWINENFILFMVSSVGKELLVQYSSDEEFRGLETKLPAHFRKTFKNSEEISSAKYAKVFGEMLLGEIENKLLENKTPREIIEIKEQINQPERTRRLRKIIGDFGRIGPEETRLINMRIRRQFLNEKLELVFTSDGSMQTVRSGNMTTKRFFGIDMNPKFE